MRIRIIAIMVLLASAQLLNAQQKNSDQNEIYIDKNGIIRLQQDGKEASFFGVNYTLPFAYGYRSHKALNIDLQKAIDMDIYHLARLGINAFRVHVWDTEISDSTGNLLNNEHLRLFDYLLSKLEERNIRIIITPIAYWGNGYPDKDEKTGSFSEKYGKDGAVVKEEAFKAQERYLSQFFKHVNPYTKKTYGQDRFVIATEINNEPHHTGAKSLATSYVNRMRAAIKSTGWTKPVFYNISESPTYADAVAKSTADGFSFQWYPTGLVAGHELLGNMLPNVDRYIIPFDTIPEFKHKPRMIYEFDAADVLKSYMYPAMARSFKTAGFQWATQFAYDPMGTAFANTEYQTHYLNLAYTPGKAISLLIAARVFKEVPLYKSYGSFPADTTFGPFTVSYKRQLSEMNAEREFYYSNDTHAVPLKVGALQHIAGVGSSPLINYKGKGAYFADRISDGNWRLEVMPDAVSVHDPFGKNSLDNPVTFIINGLKEMKVNLADLGTDFTVIALNKGNNYNAVAVKGGFSIKPGSYLLLRKGLVNTNHPDTKIGVIGITEFADPSLLGGNGPVSMKDSVLRRNADKISPLGKLTDESGAASTARNLQLYSAKKDKETVLIYSPEWKSDPYEYITDAEGKTLLKLQHKSTPGLLLGGIEVFVKGKFEGANVVSMSSVHSNIVISAGASIETPIKLNLITAEGAVYSAVAIIGKHYGDMRIPFSLFKRDTAILLPRPYPGFQALNFSAEKPADLQLKNVEKIQLLLKGNAVNDFSVEIGNIALEIK